MTGKTIIFHHLDHARAALDAAGQVGVALTLQSAPGAAVYGGVSYLKAILVRAGAQQAIIDCGENEGAAMAALRSGWKRVIFSGRADVFDKLADMAGQQGASVLQPDPDGEVLDLLDLPDPAAACRRFLESDRQ